MFVIELIAVGVIAERRVRCAPWRPVGDAEQLASVPGEGIGVILFAIMENGHLSAGVSKFGSGQGHVVQRVEDERLLEYRPAGCVHWQCAA